MWREDLKRYLLTGAAEQDPVFRHEIRRQSHLSLRVVGGASIGITCFLTIARFFIAPDPSTLRLRLIEGAIIVALGLAMIYLGRIRWGLRHSRGLALVAGWIISTLLIWWSLLMFPPFHGADDFIPFQVTLVLLVGVAAIPMQPLQMLVFGTSITLTYVALAILAERLYYPGSGPDPMNLLFMVLLTMLSTGLAAVAYQQRLSRHQAHTHTLHAAEELRLAQSRVLLSESAASLGRLAAALSHELNSPIGALISGVDTLILLGARQATAPPDDQQRLVTLQADIRATIKESANRLREIVSRMQRFTNLDRAEVQSANLNELLGDVAMLLDPQVQKGTTLQLDLQPLPDLLCRPQQISAVFGSLLNNAIGAINGDGKIVVSSRAADGSIEVEIRDNGRGVDEREIETIFDPGFKVAHGRVLTGNWSLFSSRQIVREHGGDISIVSGKGSGTSVRVTFPLEAKSAVAGLA